VEGLALSGMDGATLFGGRSAFGADVVSEGRLLSGGFGSGLPGCSLGLGTLAGATCPVAAGAADFAETAELGGGTAGVTGFGAVVPGSPVGEFDATPG
jgi:hypothetical protein